MRTTSTYYKIDMTEAFTRLMALKFARNELSNPILRIQATLASILPQKN